MSTAVSSSVLNADQSSSVSLVDVILTRTGPIDRPIELEQALERGGLRLGAVHAARNALVEDRPHTVRLLASRQTLIDELAGFGVAAMDDQSIPSRFVPNPE